MQRQYSPQENIVSYDNPLYNARRQLCFHWDVPLSGGERGRRTRADVAGQRYEGSGMMNRPGVTGGRLMMATLSVEMRCFIRCGFEGETGGAREQREGSDMR